MTLRAMKLLPSRPFFPWLILAGICVVYAGTVWRLHPTNFFGFSEDDSIYFSSARALAEGRGYILPSVPGTPPATKYPILYPWLLSWAWRWNPSFPANLAVATKLHLAFGWAYLTLAFILLRTLPEVGDGGALIVTAFCAINPKVLLSSSLLMSDIPFAALALAACAIATWVVERDQSETTAFFAGVISGLAFSIRILGLPLAAGLALGIMLRGGWRKSAIFAAGTLPFAASLLWRSLAVPRPVAPIAGPTCLHSWHMTWLYYTSYSGYWAADMMPNHVFWQVLRGNSLLALLQPGAYFLNSGVIKSAILAMALLAIVSTVAIRGVVRQAQATGLQPIHLALGLYLLPLFVWNYGDPGRFLLPFLPLIAVGLWTEARRLAFLVRTSWRHVNSFENKLACVFFCLTGATLLIFTVLSWQNDMALLAGLSRSRSSLLVEKRQAYDWIVQNSSVDAGILAYEDASAFLYTGRRSMRPIEFSPAGAYRPEILNAEMPCITSSGAPIGATYWLIAADDFGLEWEPAGSLGRKRERELESSLKLLFQSQHGGVRIYEISTVSSGQSTGMSGN